MARQKVRAKSRLWVVLGLGLLMWACASDRGSQRLPQLSERQVSETVIPSSCFYPTGIRDHSGHISKPEAVDRELALEIEKFLKANQMVGIFRTADGRKFDLPMTINAQVSAYIRHFCGSKKKVFSVYLARSSRYLPMMKGIFKKQGLPQDLAYLAMIESGFSPWARSVANAIGPWQFIRETAVRYGLKVNHWIDERRDPEKATVAAARYLKDLYRQFGSWYLAAAGYNAGEKRVEGAVNRHDTRNFWDLAKKRVLPPETCNYVPQFIAAALITKNPGKYGFTGISYQTPMRYSRVKLPGGTDLRWFARVLGISYETIKQLNPELQKAWVPLDCQEYLLKIPVRQQRIASRIAKICREMRK